MNESTYELLSFPDSFNDIISSTPSTLEQLSTFRAQLEWWFVLKPDTESFGKLSISICELLLSVPHGAFDPHEQKLAIECFRSIFHIFETYVLPYAISQWVLSPFESPIDHPLQSRWAHKLAYSLLLRRQDLFSDLESQLQITDIIHRYQAIRPFRVDAVNASRWYAPFRLIYELPSLSSSYPINVEPFLTQSINQYRQSVLHASNSIV